MNRFLPAALSVLASSTALADVPDLAESVLTEPCAAARALDECPDCKCELQTQTSPIGVDERSSSVPLGVILRVSGTKASGEEYAAAHVAMGTTTKLEHIGRVADTSSVGPVSSRTFDVVGHTQEMQMCPGGCEYEAVGLIHPFVVTTTQVGYDMESPQETVDEETRLVLCFEGAGGVTCASMPLAKEHRVTMPGATPEARRKVVSREGYERSWKFGKAGDIAFGKASGKLAKELARPGAYKISMMELHSVEDTRPITR